MASSDTRHEAADAPAWIPTYGLVLTVIFVALSALGVGALLNVLWRAPPSSGPLVGHAPPIGSAPRLQVNPEAEWRAFHRRMENRLHAAGWVDRDAGIVHMPIDRAMDLLIERQAPNAVATSPRHEQPAESARQTERSQAAETTSGGPQRRP